MSSIISLSSNFKSSVVSVDFLAGEIRSLFRVPDFGETSPKARRLANSLQDRLSSLSDRRGDVEIKMKRLIKHIQTLLKRSIKSKSKAGKLGEWVEKELLYIQEEFPAFDMNMYTILERLTTKPKIAEELKKVERAEALLQRSIRDLGEILKEALLTKEQENTP